MLLLVIVVAAGAVVGPALVGGMCYTTSCGPAASYPSRIRHGATLPTSFCLLRGSQAWVWCLLQPIGAMLDKLVASALQHTLLHTVWYDPWVHVVGSCR